MARMQTSKADKSKNQLEDSDSLSGSDNEKKKRAHNDPSWARRFSELKTAIDINTAIVGRQVTKLSKERKKLDKEANRLEKLKAELAE